VRLVIFGVIGLVVGLGGGIGYSFTLGSPAEAPADGEEATADSVQVAVEEPAEIEEPAPVDSITAEESSDSEGSDVSEVADASTATTDSAEAAPQQTRSQRIASSLIRSSARDSAAGEAPAETEPAATVADSAAATSSDAEAEAESAVPEEPAEDPVARAVEQAADLDPRALSTESEAGYRKVSRILAAMDADRAAQVLESLRDGEVRQLIGFLPARTAAAILAELDPARVARLSRGMFQPTRSSS